MFCRFSLQGHSTSPLAFSLYRDAATIRQETVLIAVVGSALVLLQRAFTTGPLKSAGASVKLTPWILGLGAIGWRLTVGALAIAPRHSFACRRR